MIARIILRPDKSAAWEPQAGRPPANDGIGTLLDRSKGSLITRRPLPDEDDCATLGANPANDFCQTARKVGWRPTEKIAVVQTQFYDGELRTCRYPSIETVNGITRRLTSCTLVGYRHIPTSRPQGAFQLRRIRLPRRN